jgi:hypothetical protein
MATPQGSSSYDVGPDVPRDTDRVLGDTTFTTPRTAPSSIVGENSLVARNRIQWGPILGGIVAALATFLLLTVLGIALGASVLGPRDEAGEIGTWAAIWGAFSIIAAFFVGGWIAARTAALDGSFAGLMQGLITGAAGLLFIIWLSASGLGNLFGTIGSSVTSIANVAASAAPAVTEAVPAGAGEEAADQAEEATGVNVADPQAVADEAVQQAQEQAGQALAELDNPDTFEAVRNGALGTFLGLLLPILAATLGGWLGKYNRQELIQGTAAA